MSACESLPQAFPENVWRLILQFVPLRQRLGVCATASKQLYRAAVAATNEVAVDWTGPRTREQTAERFWKWLHKHGHITKGLRLYGQGWSTQQMFHTRVACLPCQNLRQLQLSCCIVQLGPSNSDPGVLHVCTALTKLVLTRCQLVGGSTSLAVLSAVPTLQHLELNGLVHDDQDNHELELPATVTRTLRQLTSLEVWDTQVSLQHISCFKELQELNLSATADVTPSTTPGLEQLTALHDLVLTRGVFDPASLPHHTGLQTLCLRKVTLANAANDGPQLLLSLIGKQQQLQRLDIEIETCDWPAAPSAYTALSASSKLQQLAIPYGRFPAGVWHQVVFRPGQQLPELGVFVYYVDRSKNAAGKQATFSQQDVDALVRCCPALRSVGIPIQPGVQLTALAQLTALDQLTIDGADVTSCSSLSALSDLSSLSNLFILARDLSTASLLPLTTLHRLTSLLVRRDKHSDLRFENMVEDPASDEPDVWKQLAEHLEKGNSGSNIKGIWHHTHMMLIEGFGSSDESS